MLKYLFELAENVTLGFDSQRKSPMHSTLFPADPEAWGPAVPRLTLLTATHRLGGRVKAVTSAFHPGDFSSSLAEGCPSSSVLPPEYVPCVLLCPVAGGSGLTEHEALVCCMWGFSQAQLTAPQATAAHPCD